MTRRGFLASGLAAAAQQRPNVVLAFSPAPPSAVRFERAYAASPTQTAAMASLLTGRFPHALQLPLGEPNLASLLKAAGYAVGFRGDWPVQERPPIPAQSPRFVATVERLPVDPHTIAIYTAAHSGPPDEPGETSLRVPLAIQVPPTMRPSFPTAALVSHVDVMPTVLRLCGLEVPEGLHGRDLTVARPESVFAQGKLGRDGEWRAVIRGLDKLVIDRNGEPLALYNLGQDPQEENNLLGPRASERTKDEMLALLADWQKRVGDGRSGSGLKKR